MTRRSALAYCGEAQESLESAEFAPVALADSSNGEKGSESHECSVADRLKAQYIRWHQLCLQDFEIDVAQVWEVVIYFGRLAAQQWLVSHSIVTVKGKEMVGRAAGSLPQVVEIDDAFASVQRHAQA